MTGRPARAAISRTRSAWRRAASRDSMTHGPAISASGAPPPTVTVPTRTPRATSVSRPSSRRAAAPRAGGRGRFDARPAQSEPDRVLRAVDGRDEAPPARQDAEAAEEGKHMADALLERPAVEHTRHLVKGSRVRRTDDARRVDVTEDGDP